MTRKIQKKKLVIPPSSSPIEAEIIRMVNNIFKVKDLELHETEVKQIVRELLPDIDALIARKVKQHFYEIGSFLVEKFKHEE
jgi:hypothetical protein